MSKRYEKVLKKEKMKLKKVKRPKTIEEFMGNLTLEIKFIQNYLHKAERARMAAYEAFESMRHIIAKMQEKKLLGDNFDFDSIVEG